MKYFSEDMRGSTLYHIVHLNLSSRFHRDPSQISPKSHRRIIDTGSFALDLETLPRQFSARNPRLVHLRKGKAGPCIMAFAFVSLPPSINQKSIVFDRH